MQTKRLGRTDVDISIVGVGTAFLGIPEVNDAAQAYADMSQPFAGRVDRELGVVPGDRDFIRGSHDPLTL